MSDLDFRAPTPDSDPQRILAEPSDHQGRGRIGRVVMGFVEASGAAGTGVLIVSEVFGDPNMPPLQKGFFGAVLAASGVGLVQLARNNFRS